MKTCALPLVFLLISIPSLVWNTQPQIPRHKPALLRLVLCVQKQFGTTFDVELWEELVRQKNTTALAEHRFCNTPLRPCLPDSSGIKKSSVGERYLATLILESISLCGAVFSPSTTPKSDPEINDSADDSSIHIIVFGALIFLNITGILSGLVYKYRSDCSVRSKNNRRESTARHHDVKLTCNKSIDITG